MMQASSLRNHMLGHCLVAVALVVACGDAIQDTGDRGAQLLLAGAIIGGVCVFFLYFSQLVWLRHRRLAEWVYAGIRLQLTLAFVSGVAFAVGSTVAVLLRVFDSIAFAALGSFPAMMEIVIVSLLMLAALETFENRFMPARWASESE